MKSKTIFFLLLSALLFLAGCKTTETKPISWKRQQIYLKQIRDPRVYGLGLYDTPSGVQIRGGGRLHPNQAEALEMLAEEPFRPVVGLVGNFGKQWPVLLDLGSRKTWFEFSVAQELGARPVGERDPKLIHLPDEEVAACLSVISSLRLGQLYIENSQLYVRLATGSLGPLARDITEPELKAVIGWDILKKFEQIRFLYSAGQLLLFTTEPYEPDPSQVITAFPLVKHAGACVVRGVVDGKETMLLIDPAGDFEVATSGAAAVKSLQLGEGLTLDAPAVSESPGGTRIGARLLQKYDVAICPQEGVVYFERPRIVDGE